MSLDEPQGAKSYEAVPLNDEFLWAIRWFDAPDRQGNLLGVTSASHAEFVAFHEACTGAPFRVTRNGEPVDPSLLPPSKP